MNIAYFAIRLATLPFRFVSYKSLHRIGAALGTCAYYLIPKFRKRTLSNLSLATTLNLDHKSLKKVAQGSLQNLMITLLEYAKLGAEKEIQKIVTCLNPERAIELMQDGKGVIFFCAHQANWELLFLEGSSRMKGVAIGRPIKNKQLYDWILSIRQKFGGKIIAPKEAIAGSLRALKEPAFLGIVGDQGMPDSGFSSPFFGRKAWSSPVPALLAHRTGRPVIVATCHREKGRYFIHYSEPLFANQNAPKEKEVPRLMNQILQLLETSIAKNPEQWLWQHNRWKQQVRGRLKQRFRHEAVCIVVPHEKGILEELSVFRELYPEEFLTFLLPEELREQFFMEDAELLYYTHLEETLLMDFRFKLVYNLTEYKKIKRHYLKLSAFHVLERNQLAGEKLSDALRKEVYAN